MSLTYVAELQFMAMVYVMDLVISLSPLHFDYRLCSPPFPACSAASFVAAQNW